MYKKNGKQITHFCFSVSCIAVFLFSCQKNDAAVKYFAKVGGKMISQENYETFSNMRYMYPADLGDNVYPGQRTTPSLCVETEALYNDAKSILPQLQKTDDWAWKRKFFIGQMYLIEVVEKNWGFLDKELKAYYDSHKEEFKKVITVKALRDPGSDSAVSEDSSDNANIVERDSVTYMPFENVKVVIAKKLFFEKYPPDSAFYVSYKETTSDSDLVDTARIKQLYYNRFYRQLPDYFMKEMYKERFNEKYPDSLEAIFGDGNIITPKDMEVILGWISKSQREEFKAPEKQKFLAEWLLKWKLFSDKAKENEFAKSKEVQDIVEWGEKFTLVMEYVNSELVPKAQSDIVVDTLMALYEYWDQSDNPGIVPDSATMAQTITSSKNIIRDVKLEKSIHSIRKKAGVTFLQSDFTDEKTHNPEELAKKADSLYAEDERKEAENAYKKLVENYAFLPEGQNALIEYAKILTENERYYEAVRNYRRYLLLAPNQEKRCNVFFMTGFVYGEYLNKPELAELSYKWILKHQPSCDLADDAEFMCLHLNEPMIGVEELQEESRRQGKVIENDQSAVIEEQPQESIEGDDESDTDT